jgi:hypothetical protein
VKPLKTFASDIIGPRSDKLRDDFQDSIRDLKFRPVPLREWQLSKDAASIAYGYIEGLIRLTASAIRDVVSVRQAVLSESEIVALFGELKPDRPSLESFVYQTTTSYGIPGDGNMGIAMSRSYERTADEELAKLKLLAKEPSEARHPDRAVPMVEPEPDFRPLTSDEKLREHLKLLWEEAVFAFGGHAYLSTVIVLGSLLEGALLAKCLANDEVAQASTHAPKANGKVKPYNQWSLSDFIEVADDNRWIHKTRNDFADTLRDYRNMVHPFNAYGRGYKVDKPMAAICWEVVKATLSDLGAKI